MRPDYLADMLRSDSPAARRAGQQMLAAAERLTKKRGPLSFTAKADDVLHERPHITPTAAAGFLGAMCGIFDVGRELDEQIAEAAE